MKDLLSVGRNSKPRNDAESAERHRVNQRATESSTCTKQRLTVHRRKHLLCALCVLCGDHLQCAAPLSGPSLFKHQAQTRHPAFDFSEL
jgi:hypothetical protein